MTKIYLYKLLDPTHKSYPGINSIYYIGQTVNPTNRRFGHHTGKGVKSPSLGKRRSVIAKAKMNPEFILIMEATSQIALDWWEKLFIAVFWPQLENKSPGGRNNPRSPWTKLDKLRRDIFQKQPLNSIMRQVLGRMKP